MQYATLADIVDGFETARQWRIIRKGEDNWSLIGLDANNHIVHEIENLYYKQCELLQKCIKEDAEIVKIATSSKVIQRISIVNILSSCLFFLTNGVEGSGLRSKEKTIDAVKKLIQEISQ